MIQSLYVQSKTQQRLADGLLGPYLELIVQILHHEEYKDGTIRHYLRNADLFGRWLAKQEIPVEAVDDTTVKQYVSSFKRLKHPTRANGCLPENARGIQKILAILRQQRIVPKTIPPEPSTVAERWLKEYSDHLEHEAGLANGTRHNYLRYAKALIDMCFGVTELDWGALDAYDVTEFVCEQSRRLKGSSTQSPVTATRSFLRFLSFKGEIHSGLIGAVPTVRRYKQTSLPNYLSQEEVARALVSYDENTSLGQRNHVIIMLLARFGLRAGEVARLRLEDIDWQEGRVLIRAGKSARERSLPLPQDVGDTLSIYLQQARPQSNHRELFLRARVPHTPLKSCAISSIARQLLQHLGVTGVRLGSHLFRHTVATQMVQNGVSFKEIADVLGHACLDTTFIYAKVDLPTLARAAMPWPGGAS